MRSSRLLVAAPFSLAALLFSACGGGEKPVETAQSTGAASASASTAPPPPTASAVASSAPVASSSPPATIAPAIKLLGAGADPKAPLRYQFKGAKAQDGDMDLKMTMQIKMGDNQAPGMTMPTVRTGMHVAPKEVSDAGDLTYSFEISAVSVLNDTKAPAQVVAALKGEMAKIKGMKGKGTVSSRGEPKNVEFEIPPDINAQAKQLMENLRQQITDIVVQFPEEPIGKGAKWEKTAHLTLGGLTLDQTATYTLLETKGTTAHIAAAIVQTAKPQDVKAPGLPPGAHVSLEAFDTKGSGDQNVDLTALLSKSTSKVSSKTSMKIELGEKGAQPMQTNVDMTVSLTPKK